MLPKVNPVTDNFTYVWQPNIHSTVKEVFIHQGYTTLDSSNSEKNFHVNSSKN